MMLATYISIAYSDNWFKLKREDDINKLIYDFVNEVDSRYNRDLEFSKTWQSEKKNDIINTLHRKIFQIVLNKTDEELAKYEDLRQSIIEPKHILALVANQTNYIDLIKIFDYTGTDTYENVNFYQALYNINERISQLEKSIDFERTNYDIVSAVRVLTHLRSIVNDIVSSQNKNNYKIMIY